MKTLNLKSTIFVALLTAAVPAFAGNIDLPLPLVPIHGPWQVSINPVNCNDGTPFPFVFVTYVTFATGGTVAETTSAPNFDPGQRTGGQGYWEYTGRKTYRAHYQAFVLFDSANGPYTRGTQVFDHSIEMTDRDHWASDVLVNFYNTSGLKVPPSGCAKASAVRMQ